MNDAANPIPAQVQAGVAVAQAVAPLLPPNVQSAIALAAAATAAVSAWVQSGQVGDVTDEQLQALFDRYDLQRLDDQKAQAEAVNRAHSP